MIGRDAPRGPGAGGEVPPGGGRLVLVGQLPRSLLSPHHGVATSVPRPWAVPCPRAGAGPPPTPSGSPGSVTHSGCWDTAGDRPRQSAPGLGQTPDAGGLGSTAPSSEEPVQGWGAEATCGDTTAPPPPKLRGPARTLQDAQGRWREVRAAGGRPSPRVVTHDERLLFQTTESVGDGPQP